MESYSDFIGLGIAGNFALHLEQAGELEDFKDLDILDESAPKGLFPFYLKGSSTQLGVYPLSSTKIQLPADRSLRVQAEPEVALICELEYIDGKVCKVIPKQLAAYNDCSIRREGATKISQKKNWGDNSKGISGALVDIDSFKDGADLDSWHIVSYLRHGDTLHQYGEDAPLVGYSYFHTKLLDWIVVQLNEQIDIGPLEPISEYLQELNYPQRALISIGATRYTTYGESRFLKEDDEVIVALYDSKIHSSSDIQSAIVDKQYDLDSTSILTQKVYF